MPEVISIRSALILLSAGLTLGYASLRLGGVLSADWNVCAFALGCLLLFGYLPLSRDAVSAPFDPLLYACILAVPLWALVQSVPLPAAWIAVLSPERTALSRALLHFGAVANMPLSVRPQATLQYGLRYLAFGATFLVTRDLMWRLPGKQWLIVLPPLLIAVVEASIGIVQDSSGVANTTVSGTFVNRNQFSALLEMCLPFAVGLILDFAPQGARALAACAGALVSALLMAGIVLSLSRGGYFIALLSFLFLGWVYALTRLRGLARIFTMLVSLLAVAGATLALASGRLLDRMLPAAAGLAAEASLSDRIAFWKETLHVITAYPIFGCGFGGFISAVTPFRATAAARTLDYAHNDYLQFLAEGGFIAVIPAAIVGILIARALWRGVFLQPHPRRRTFAIACMVSVFAGMFHSAFDLITYVPATGMLLCWIAGMAAGLEFDL